MSQQMAVKILSLIESSKAQLKRLDSLEKAVNNLKKAVSHMERSPDKKTGVRVPLTPLPDMLTELEIGNKPKGT
jgi:hypothetical protein